MKCLFYVLPAEPFGQTAKVFSPNQCGEYVVRFYTAHNAIVIPDADYFTDDYDDACGTAIHAINSPLGMEMHNRMAAIATAIREVL